MATHTRRRNLGEELVIFGNPTHFQVEHVAPTPRGWHVRTKREGQHELRIAFPPGPRRTGAGRLVEVLHPKKENPTCGLAHLHARQNPQASVSTRKEAEAKRAEWEAQGFQVSIHPMHGGTFAVLATKKAKNSRRRHNQADLLTDAETGAGDVSTETEQAVRLFEKFHGKEPAEILEVQRSAAMRLDYTALGDLVAIGVGPADLRGQELVNHWEDLPNIGFEGEGVKLASAPSGRQLYLIGGNQDLTADLPEFEGVDPEKDLIDLGEAGFLVYLARKWQTKFEPIEWVHELGEETGVLPRLVFDRIKSELCLVGGDYFIDLTEFRSPGIEN